MDYEVKLEKFQGPFDLLLQLIEQEELDITEISLAKITKQYIEHLQKVEELYPEELADFLVVATKLLLIKSRTLLPYLQWEEEEDESNLEEQLKIYREFHEASQTLEKMLLQRNFTYGRLDSRYDSPEIVFSPPEKITASSLQKFFINVLESLEPVIKLPQSAIAKAVTLKEKLFNLQEALTKTACLSFKDIISQAENKTDVIITFLAILELVKQQTITVNQQNNFEDITIEKI
ncbi:MAG: ScpA family protein [Patescibacteria group bacterium]